MLVNEFWKIPFLRFILPFIAGIILASMLAINLTLLISLASFFIGCNFVYRPFLNHDQSYHNRWIFGLLTSIAIFFVGASITTYQSKYSDAIINAKNIIGIVNEPIKETAKSVKLELLVNEYQINEVWQSGQIKVLVYLEKDSVAKSLQYGDRLLLGGNVKAISNSGNPDEFDYKTYLSRKKIYFQTYQNSQQWLKLSSGSGNVLFSIAYWLRNRALVIYKESGITGDEFAILAALTLGVKDYLSDEIVEAYSDSGAMHVLAVSGLHVGIILLVMSWLLSFMKRKHYLLVIQSIIIILLIWTFALITGLAPSVTRAALMLSFILIGKISRKKPSIYNTMAASAFIILLFNPLALFQVGFQLSYIAVLSIVLFQPRIYGLFDIKNKWLDKIWQLTAVSVSAQIGTSAISIYYFHQFPLYALVTNIIAIPAAFLIMCGAIILLLSSVHIVFAKIVAVVLSLLIKCFNISTAFIEHLPAAAIEYISLSGWELMFTYIAICLGIFYSINKNRQFLYLGCLFFVLVFFHRDIRHFTTVNSTQFVVFNTNRKTAFATIADNKMILYADSSLYKNKRSIDFLSSNLIASSFSPNFKLVNLDDDSMMETPCAIPVRFFQADTLKVAFISGKISGYSSDNKLNVNYLVLNKNATLNIEAICSLFSFEKLIIDSSIPKWKQDVLIKDCEDAQISYFNVSDEGAFVWKRE